MAGVARKTDVLTGLADESIDLSTIDGCRPQSWLLS